MALVLSLIAFYMLDVHRASVDVPLPMEPCWVLWEDRERIPKWMPWIKSVKVSSLRKSCSLVPGIGTGLA